VQIAHSVKGYVLQNIQTGPQAQWVWPFLDGALQLQVLASALAGGANTGNDVIGAVPLVPTVQLSAGGQVTYAIPGTGKHVLIGFQLAGQLTGTAGQGTTGALVPQGFVQVQW
jgi:ABC-type arginine/histidine transport system permease subunit